MASPAPSEDKKPRAEVNYKFCQECSNLLYPKEDRDRNALMYICKACHHVEDAEAACTYRNQLGSTVTETAGVTTDVANDPTVGDSSEDIEHHLCLLCGQAVMCKKCGRSLLVDNKK